MLIDSSTVVGNMKYAGAFIAAGTLTSTAGLMPQPKQIEKTRSGAWHLHEKHFAIVLQVSAQLHLRNHGSSSVTPPAGVHSFLAVH
jgi:hypothetical protein